MTGDTDAEGMAAIRFARSAATGNQVYAGVAAPAGSYDASGVMQAVMWDPKYPMAMASNENDIVNTKADFSFSGATVMTDMGGGKALGGWKIEVTSGDEAVDGAPAALGDGRLGEGLRDRHIRAEDLRNGRWSAAEGQANDSISGDGGEKYTSDRRCRTPTTVCRWPARPRTPACSR